MDSGPQTPLPQTPTPSPPTPDTNADMQELLAHLHRLEQENRELRQSPVFDPRTGQPMNVEALRQEPPPMSQSVFAVFQEQQRQVAEAAAYTAPTSSRNYVPERPSDAREPPLELPPPRQRRHGLVVPVGVGVGVADALGPLGPRRPFGGVGNCRFHGMKVTAVSRVTANQVTLHGMGCARIGRNRNFSRRKYKYRQNKRPTL